MRTLIIIPAYNEALNIEAVVNNLIKNYPQYDYVVVNDGSNDNTFEVCRRNNYNVLDLPINIGLTGAVRTGMKYAAIKEYDAAIQFDGDGQHRAEYISVLEKALTKSGGDIAIGARVEDIENASGIRKLGSLMIKGLIKLTTGQRLSDPTSGMRLYNRKMITEFANNMSYSPEPDTMAYLIRQGAKIVEVPVKMDARESGISYLNFTRAMRYMLNICISIVFIQWFRKGRK